MKISFIIPIYNTETYLSKCVKSILSLNLNTNYEIILIDDGSTDNSSKLCDDFSKKYSFIKVFHKQNGGVSSARNFGLNKASGEYVYFVDSDDFLLKNKNLDTILNNLSSDIVQFKMNYYYEKYDKYVQCNDLKEYTYINEKERFLYDMICSNTLSVSPCDKIINRNILIKNNIYFEEGLIGEDIDWSLKLYIYVNSIKTVNKEIYSYRQNRKGSITNHIAKKNIKSIIYIIDKWVNYNYKDDRIKELYYNYIAYQYVLLLAITNKNNCTKKSKIQIDKFDFLLKYDLSYKVKMCNKVFSIFGRKIGLYLLKIYIRLKNNGIIKL